MAAAARTPAVGEAAAHYSQWMAFAHRQQCSIEELLPHLSVLRAYQAGATIANVASETAAASLGGSDVGCGGPPGIVAAPLNGIDWGIEGTDAGIVTAPVDGIDWGVEGAEELAEASGIVEPPSSGIDWDLGALSVVDATPGVVEVPTGGIDWDFGVAADDAEDETPGVVEPPDGGIDWGVDMSCVTAEAMGAADRPGAGESVVEIKWDIGDVVVEDAGGNLSTCCDGGGSGRGFSIGGSGIGGGSDEARRPFHARLEEQDFRAAVVDELLELRAFLRQRAADLRSKEATSLLSSAPTSVQSYVAPDALLSLVDAVHAPVGVLRGDAARRLLLISSSQRYRGRLVSDLEAKAALEGKLLGALKDLEEKRAETRLSHRQSVARGDALCKALREIKAALEGIISKQYRGRAVHVIGEINNVLG